MWPFAFTSLLTHSLLEPRICQQQKSIPCTYHQVQVYYAIKVELSYPYCHAALNKQIDEANLNIIWFGRGLCSVLASITRNLCWIGRSRFEWGIFEVRQKWRGVKTDPEFLYNASKLWHAYLLYEHVTLSPHASSFHPHDREQVFCCTARHCLLDAMSPNWYDRHTPTAGFAYSSPRRESGPGIHLVVRLYEKNATIQIGIKLLPFHEDSFSTVHTSLCLLETAVILPHIS